jgi:nucleoside-diphosphate-sugar epimerase
MKAFVTGATGFLGIHLVQLLCQEGWEVFAFHRQNSDLSELKKLRGITYLVGDVTDKESVANAMPEAIDAVFHAAGSVGFLEPKKEKLQYHVNELGTRNVVEVALAKRARRFVYTSTILTYEFTSGRRITEASPPNTSSAYAYAHSKYLAECEVEQGVRRGLDAVFIHPSAIFGAYDKSTWSKMFREIQRGLRVPFAPPGEASVCHMRKVAEAHLRAFERGRTGEHYVLGGVDVDYLELSRSIARILKRPGPFFVLPGPLFRLIGRCEYRVSTLLGREPMLTPPMADILCEKIVCDSSKAVSELNYAPSSLQTMLQDCYDWMVSADMLPAKAA